MQWAFSPSYFGGGPLKFRAGKSTAGVALPVQPRDVSEIDERVAFYKRCRAEGIRFTKRRRGTGNAKKLRRLVKLARSTPAQRLALTSRQRARANRVRLGRLVSDRAAYVDRRAKVNAQLAKLIALSAAE